MKIIIAGAGEVGTHLANLLSKENFDIVLMDEDIDRLAKLSQDMDIMTLGVSPLSIKSLRQAGAENADLLIAVTPNESDNITCALIAKQLGTKKTVARVDNYEYVDDKTKLLFRNAGVDHLVYPEKLSAKEVAASAQYSWVRQWWDFDGDLVLLSVKMHDSHPLKDEIKNDDNQFLGKTLREIGQRGHQFHVVAIQRQGDTIIPYGDEKICTRDLVFFMAKRGEIDTIRHMAGKDDYPAIKRVMIIGGGKLSVRTDWALPDNLSVKIIEPDMARCEKLGEMTKDRTLIINGDGYDMELLKDEGYGNLDAFIALTPNDEENILACVAARKSGVRKTIAQVENLAYHDMAEQLDVGTIINKKVVAASFIYQMLLKADVKSVKTLTIADADVAEFVIKEGSSVTRKPVKDIGLPKEINIGGLVRKGEGMLVSGSTYLQAGDRLVVFCSSNTLNKLDKYFR
ncbi:MAG: Trk system potassium transporter TrkA [Bacteroidaceae bacterium]|nr:Trk system potassium transporter TrkA [Bacteroidaceae bacterium]